jgi:hypothetical protein
MLACMSQHRYSLMRGGLVHRLLQASGALRCGARLSCWLAILVALLSTLPLLLSCLAANTLWSTHAGMGLFGDYATLCRLLIALPLLVVAAPRADALLQTALRQLSRASMVHPRRSVALDDWLATIRRLRDGWFPEVACVLVAFAPALSDPGTANQMPGIADWRWIEGDLTTAGRWYEGLSLPLFRLLLLLWLWRFLLWSILLLRLPRLGLLVRPEHPDGAGGLAFLGDAQQRFAVLSLAAGIVLGGACINHIVYLGQPLSSMAHLLGGYVLGSTVALVAPLLLLSPAMLRARRHALYRFGALGSRAATQFEQRWRSTPTLPAADESLLDHGDASALADFGSVYHTLATMAVIPLSRWNLLSIALHAALPLCPLLLFAMSIDELVSKLLNILV